MSKAVDEKDKETTCGLFNWRPDFLQPLASKKVYMVLYGILGIVQVSLFFEPSVTLWRSSLEKLMESKNKFSSISEHVFHLPLCHVEHSRAQIRHQIQRGRLHYVRQRNKSIPLPLRHAFHGQGKEQKVNLSTNSSLKIMVILNFQLGEDSRARI